MLLAANGGTYACIKVALLATNNAGFALMQKKTSTLAYIPQDATVFSEGTRLRGVPKIQQKSSAPRPPSISLFSPQKPPQNVYYILRI